MRHRERDGEGQIVVRGICAATASAAFIGGILTGAPATAADPAGLAAVGAVASTEKRDVVVTKISVAKDQRSVTGRVTWHSKKLAKGENHFTVWAGISDGSGEALTLGRIHRQEKALGRNGAMRFTVSWGRSKAAEVTKVRRIRVSATQRFNKAGTGKIMESAHFDTVDAATNGTPGTLEPTGGSTCSDHPLTRGANLKRCLFDGLDLYFVDLTSSYLELVKFLNCNLGRAKFNGARGANATFSGDDLSATEFISAKFPDSTFGPNNTYNQNTWFFGADLSTVNFYPATRNSVMPSSDSDTKCPGGGKPGPCMFPVR